MQGIELPAASDALVIIVLILPGFISLSIIRRIGIVEGRLGTFEATVWSLFLTLLIHATTSLIRGLQIVDFSMLAFLRIENIGLVVLLSIVYGVVPAYIIRQVWRRGMTPGSLWDRIVHRMFRKGGYGLVYASDGTEYKGKLAYAGLGKSPKEVALKEPKWILRDDVGRIKAEFQVGEVVLFRQDDVRRIVFFKPID